MSESLFPIFFYNDEVITQEGNYYIVAGNGIFLHKDNGSSVCLVPVDTISSLPDIKTSMFLQWKLPKIPKDLIFKIKAFFEEVYDTYKSEANVILYYNFDNKTWHAQVPKQVVRRGSVDYTLESTPSPELRRVATIHSHGKFQAFHSPQDVQDEEYFDGLHCTFGNIKSKAFSISANIVTNGYRESIDPLIVCDGIKEVQRNEKFPHIKNFELTDIQIFDHSDWMEQISYES